VLPGADDVDVRHGFLLSLSGGTGVGRAYGWALTLTAAAAGLVDSVDADCQNGSGTGIRRLGGGYDGVVGGDVGEGTHDMDETESGRRPFQLGVGLFEEAGGVVGEAGALGLGQAEPIRFVLPGADDVDVGHGVLLSGSCAAGGWYVQPTTRSAQ